MRNIFRLAFEHRYRARLAKIVIGKNGFLRILSREAVQTRKVLEDKAKKFGVGNKSLEDQNKEMMQISEAMKRQKYFAMFNLHFLVFTAFLYAVTMPLELAFSNFSKSHRRCRQRERK